MDEWQYLWDYFKFNAEQRLKAFNFFILLSVFSGGGVFTAIEKELSNIVVIILGFFIIFLSMVFWVIDARSKQLLNLAVPGLRRLELNISEEKARPFYMDCQKKSSIIRYTVAFRCLFVVQFVFGLGVCLYGVGYVWTFHEVFF